MDNNKITRLSFVFFFLCLYFSLIYSNPVLCQHKKHHAHHHSLKSHHPTQQATKLTTRQTHKQQADTDNQMSVNPHVWQLALKAYNKAFEKGYIKQRILTVIDYSLPSSVKRMWVVDLAHKKVLYHTLVTHGRHTGGLFAKHFSDKPGSLASSLGLFLTENTYVGSQGYSLRLRGLEPGFNDKAFSRSIVMHGAWYATHRFAAHYGRLGLSWGCPAVSPQLAKPIINEIKGGSLVFAYYPDVHWLHQSKFLL